MKNLIVILLLSSFLSPQSSIGLELAGGDLLNESPLTPIPKEMTFEEYRDMNRRLTIGLLLTKFPVPGIIHDYANEKKTAKRIRRIALGSVGLIIVGGSMANDDEGDWAESNYQVHIVNEGLKDETRYEMIPTGMEAGMVDTTISYDLIPLYREIDGGTGGLIALLGIGLLIADIAYDVFHGAMIIEQKRDAVRYKYGQQMNFSFGPEMNLKNKYAGVKISYNF